MDKGSMVVFKANMDKKVEQDDVEDSIEEGSEEGASRVYELGFHIVSSVLAEEIPREFGNVKSMLEKHGAIFISEEMPALLPLAYPMFKVFGTKKEKFVEAYFGWIKFDATVDAIVEIKKEVEAYENVLRFIIMKTVRENTMIQPKLASKKPESDKKTETTTDSEDVVEESIETIDESIDKLVIE